MFTNALPTLNRSSSTLGLEVVKMTKKIHTPQARKHKFYIRNFISLFLIGSVLLEVASGVALYLAPSGRVAQTMSWELLWLTKTQWEAIHTVFGLLWIPILATHIFLNWKPILSYLKNHTTRAFAFKRELLAALAVVLFFALGSVYNWPPVSQVMALSESMSSFWENRGRTAGYFIPEETVVHPETTATTPTNPSTPADPTLSSTVSTKRGYGKYTVQSWAEENKVELQTALKRLADLGINAKADESLLALSGRSGKLPSELAAIILGQPLSTPE
ncbi:hypothetical protein Mhypo_01847 [Meiothermus hypogaeus]|nr:hypothetical protein Mhypo_01847 [Meiothermus hypogaeus]